MATVPPYDSGMTSGEDDPEIRAQLADVINRTRTDAIIAGLTPNWEDPAPPVTMDGMLSVIAKLRERGFPDEAPSIRVADREAFKEWISRRVPMHTSREVAPIDQIYGIPVVVDTRVPTDVISINGRWYRLTNQRD